ncbi:MAG: hypothetical protein QNL93_02700, partial [Opitutae bacterium]
VVGESRIGLERFNPLSTNGSIIQKWAGSTLPRWRIVACGYGIKQMDGAGHKKGFIPTSSDGEIPPGFIFKEELVED